MLIVLAMKFVRDVFADAIQLRRELMKRYPGIVAE